MLLFFFSLSLAFRSKKFMGQKLVAHWPLFHTAACSVCLLHCKIIIVNICCCLLFFSCFSTGNSFFVGAECLTSWVEVHVRSVNTVISLMHFKCVDVTFFWISGTTSPADVVSPWLWTTQAARHDNPQLLFWRPNTRFPRVSRVTCWLRTFTRKSAVDALCCTY